MNLLNDQLPVDLITQLIEHCTGIMKSYYLGQNMEGNQFICNSSNVKGIRQQCLKKKITDHSALVDTEN